MESQQQLAREVACLMQDDGHDVIDLDVLDCLATLGLELIRPPDPATPRAYADALIEHVAKRKQDG